jgi:hypothetical protein
MGFGYRSQVAQADRSRITDEIDCAVLEERDLKSYFHSIEEGVF